MTTKNFLLIFALASSLYFFSCSNDAVVTNAPLPPEKFKWETVDSVTGYFPGEIVAGDNGYYFYINNNYVYKCGGGTKTPINISSENFAASTLYAYNNDYLLCAGSGSAGAAGVIYKVKIINGTSVSEISIDTLSDYFRIKILVLEPDKFVISAGKHYYYIENGTVKKFIIDEIYDIYGISKTGGTVFLTAYQYSNGVSIYKLKPDFSYELYETENSFSQRYPQQNTIIKSRYEQGYVFLDYLTEAGWTNFYRGTAQFFNYMLEDSYRSCYMIYNTSDYRIEFHGNYWNGNYLSADEDFPFKVESWQVIYYSNFKDNTLYVANNSLGMKIYRGKKITQ